MRVALVKPFHIAKKDYFAVHCPTNLCYLASVLRKKFDVQIWDYSIESFKPEEFVQRISKNGIDIVGFTAVTPSITQAAKMAFFIKESYPSIPIIVGGVHVSALPEKTLEEFPVFDFIVIGEGEETMMELCEASRNKKDIRGIAYRDGKEFKRTTSRPLIEDINTIPFPARDLLNLDAYKGYTERGFWRGQKSIAEIYTSRGCPERCTFCASKVINGHRVRYHSVEYVASEIEECIKKYNINHFTIEDDTFTLRRDRLWKICDIFKKNRVTWNCNTRVNAVTLDMLQHMKRSGCEGIVYGVESGSPRILETINKRITIQQAKQAFKWSHEAGIKNIEADFILGVHPDERPEDILMTLDLIDEIKPTMLGVSIGVPYPGTKFYEMMKQEGFPSDWNDFVIYGNEPQWRLKHLSIKELIDLQNKVLRRFYLNPRYLVSKLKRISSFKEFFGYANTGIKFLRDSLRA